MARKPKQEIPPNPSSISNRDILQRLNFLYQASAHLATVSESRPQTTRSKQKDDGFAMLSRTYTRSMKSIGRKALVRMDPSVKRAICKGCNTILLPGSTATVRLKNSHSHYLVKYTCIHCNTCRSIPAAPNQAADPVVKGLQLEPSGSETTDVTEPANRSIKPMHKWTIPFFQREDIGHAVFRGNQRLDQDDENDNVQTTSNVPENK